MNTVSDKNGKKKSNANRSTLISHNLSVCGMRTSVRLEKEMWMAFKDIALLERCTVHDLATEVSLVKKEMTSLTAAIRVFIMTYFQSASTTAGHQSAGHGQGVSVVAGTVQAHANTPYYGLRMMKSFEGK